MEPLDEIAAVDIVELIAAVSMADNQLLQADAAAPAAASFVAETATDHLSRAAALATAESLVPAIDTTEIITAESMAEDLVARTEQQEGATGADGSIETVKKKKKSYDELWGQGRVYKDGVRDADLDAIYAQLAIEEYEANVEMYPWALHKGKDKIVANTAGIRVTTRKCWYHNSAGCKFVVREEYNVKEDKAKIIIGTYKHSDHTRVRKDKTRANKRKGMPKHIKAQIFKSPSKLRTKRRDLATLAEKAGVVPDLKLQSQMIRKVERAKVTRHGGKPQTWGAFNRRLDRFRKENISNFNEHTPYLLKLEMAPGNAVDVEKRRMVAVFSTENLLLNAYRQCFWGYPVFVAADASYRYNQEGYPLFPLITTNIAQQAKVIAYALLSNEDGNAQEVVFGAVKAEVERIVEYRKQNDIPIYM